MSELKARHIIDVYDDYAEQPCEERSQVYLKSEADKVIAELKEKLKGQTFIAEEGWKEFRTYYSSYAEAAKELYEKNKELRHQKYKRCLAMARWCAAECVVNQDTYKKYSTHKSEFRITHLRKWYLRWLKIAEQFKEAK